MINTNLIPHQQRSINYVSGNITVSTSGKIVIMRSDGLWAPLYDRQDGTYFYDVDYKWYKIIIQKINEYYSIGVKVN